MKKILMLFFAGAQISTLCVGFVSCDEKPQLVHVSNIELTPILSLEVGEKQILTATVLPADAENRTVSWKSEDESIAEVSSLGEVTAAGAGTTSITATAAEGEKTASCTVTVTAKPGHELQGTLPVTDIPEEVTAFFKKYLPSRSISHPESEFNFGKGDECFIINNMEEFKAIAPLSVELPVIDFEKHTLIIGQHWMGDPGYTLEKQAVDTEPEEMVLNLVYKRMEGASPAVPTIFYFWGLYPKLPQKSVILNIVKQYI